MEILCIDDNFTQQQLDYIAKHGLETPVQSVVYTVRAVVTTSTGERGLLLNEIVNPQTPRISPDGMQWTAEQSWKLSKFTTLLGKPLTEKHLKQLKNETNPLSFALCGN